MTGRLFLVVTGCDDRNAIALDNLTGNELGLLTEVCAALVTAQGGHDCRPAAVLTPVDPDVDEREETELGYPFARPLVVVQGLGLTEWVGPVIEAGRVRRAEEAARDEVCCSWGCGTGACETCPCCCAGWCIGGRDGIPGTATCEPDADPDQVAYFYAVAAEHNPLAAEVVRLAGEVERLTIRVDDEPDGVPEPCRNERCRLDEGHDGTHRYYANPSDDPWAPATTTAPTSCAGGC